MRISDWSSDVCSSDLWPVTISLLSCHSPKLVNRRKIDTAIIKPVFTLIFRAYNSGLRRIHRDFLRRIQTTLLEVRYFEHKTRSEEHTSELQSLMRNSYAVFCLKKKKTKQVSKLYNLPSIKILQQILIKI